MHRLLASREALLSDCPSLSREAISHLKVLRPKDGEQIELFDGCGYTRICAYSASTRTLCPIADPVKHPSPEGGLTLFACITKGSRWDWTIEKATELGVNRIVPVISDRTIVRIPPAERAAKRERWLRIAEDAARQSDAVWLPEISEALDFAEALKLAAETACFIGALTDPPSPPLFAAVAALKGDSRRRSVFIGLEGDFTSEELRSLMEIGIPTSFGPTILRAETAALFAVSVLSSVRY